jgi:Tol biopolymer transport system component
MALLRLTFTAVVFLVLLASYPTARTAGPEFSDWSQPVNLGPLVNSSSDEGSPAVSKNGRSLYFASTRPGQLGGNDIYVSQWDDGTGEWGLPVNLGPVVNTTATEFSPSLSRDGHWLFFHSNRPGSIVPGVDIWVSYRQHVHDDFDWRTPFNLGSGVNAAGLDTSPSFFENDDVGIPQLFFASNRNVAGANDIYVSNMLADGSFGPAILVPELSSPAVEPGVSVRFDGREVFLFSSRTPSFGGFDLWTSTRETVFHPWSVPTNLGSVINTAANEGAPHITSDRRSLYFQSNRGGGFGGGDLYVTTRTKRR